MNTQEAINLAKQHAEGTISTEADNRLSNWIQNSTTFKSTARFIHFRFPSE